MTNGVPGFDLSPKLVRRFGSVMVGLGWVVVWMAILGIFFSLFPRPGEPVPVAEIIRTIFVGIAVVVVGKLIHLLLAVHHQVEETNALVRLLLERQEHNKSLNADAGDAGAG